MLALQGATTLRNGHDRPTQPPPLPVAAILRHRIPRDWPPVWWVGCHGGAGTSTLCRLTGLGLDVGAAWPAHDLGAYPPPTSVVLVCRLTAGGTWAAMGAVDQWRRRMSMAPDPAPALAPSPYLMPPGIQVTGIVAVAASPRRPPRLATDRLRLLSGWVPRVWRVGWVDALLAADDPTEVGMPPDVDALRHHLSTTTTR